MVCFPTMALLYMHSVGKGIKLLSPIFRTGPQTNSTGSQSYKHLSCTGTGTGTPSVVPIMTFSLAAYFRLWKFICMY
jgi:hypothetical protein